MDMVLNALLYNISQIIILAFFIHLVLNNEKHLSTDINDVI